jgi:hypothetical protein
MSSTILTDCDAQMIDQQLLFPPHFRKTRRTGQIHRRASNQVVSDGRDSVDAAQPLIETVRHVPSSPRYLLGMAGAIASASAALVKVKRRSRHTPA